MKVLIVEDDKDFLWFFKQSFENQGFDLLTAETGEAGLEIAEKEQPDLMVIDIMLKPGGITGIEMAKQLKDKGSKAQMIFLTNLKDAEHVSQALEAVGESDYFVKADVHMDIILGRVKAKLGIQ